MRFFIQIGGEHSEGAEGQTRLNKLVAAFVDGLVSNGFIPDAKLAVHDFDTQELAPSSPEPASEATTETHGEPAASLSVNFASDAATELADDAKLTDTDFAGVEPSGTTGFTVADVREIIDAKTVQ